MISTYLNSLVGHGLVLDWAAEPPPSRRRAAAEPPPSRDMEQRRPPGAVPVPFDRAVALNLAASR